MTSENAARSANRPHSIGRLGLVCGAIALAAAATVAGRWAYEAIPEVHYRVALAWAWAYDAAVPHPDILPTPIEAVLVAAPTFALPSQTATAQATARPRSLVVASPAEGSATPAVEASTTEPPATATAIPGSVLLKGIRHEQQYFNNCGPTTLAMDLSYWGWQGDQHVVAASLRPNQDDKNVSPPEILAYLRANGYDGVVRVNGEAETLKRFIAAGYPVMVQKGLVCSEGDDHCSGWVGHYALVVGYDDPRKEFVLEDSFRGSGIKAYYRDLLADWRAFNYVYIVPFPDDAARRAEVLGLLGDEADVERNYQEALTRAEAEAASSKFSPAAFAWFNIGTNLTALGDYADAAAAYDQARQIKLPSFMLWYQFGPFQAYFETGRYDDLEHLASFAISAAHLSGVEEAYYWRGRAREAMGLHDKALADFRAALGANPTYLPAQQALTAPTGTP